MKLIEEKDKDKNNLNENENKPPIKFESFNISIDDKENPLANNNRPKILYIILFFVSIILAFSIILYFIFKEDINNKIICEPGYFIPEDDIQKKKLHKMFSRKL